MAKTKKAIPYIQVGKDYRISWDGLNITLLYHCKPRKAGQDGSWRPVGYYSTFKDALEGLVDEAVKSPDLKDLKAVVKKQDELYKLIQTLKTPQEFLQKPPSESMSPSPLSERHRGNSKTTRKKKEGIKIRKEGKRHSKQESGGGDVR